MTVFRRGPKWVAQVPQDGRTKQIGTFETKREAVAAERAALRRRPSSNMTIGEWRDEWLRTPRWRESTRDHNEGMTRRFVEAHGDMKIARFDRRMARAWLDEHKASLGAVSAMFGAAEYVDDEHGQPLVARNPFSKLDRHEMKRRDLEADWLTEDDLCRLEDAARAVHGEQYGPVMAGMIRFAAETGIRPGELYALEWGDLDPERGVAYIRRQVTKRGTLGPTKNGRERTVVLSQRAHEAAVSARFAETDLLFVTPGGRRFRQPTMHYHWHPVRVAFDRPDMVFYELRHVCATRLLEAGVSSEDVAVQLGHTDGGELVRRVYGHPAARHSLDRVRRAMESEAA